MWLGKLPTAENICTVGLKSMGWQVNQIETNMHLKENEQKRVQPSIWEEGKIKSAQEKE